MFSGFVGSGPWAVDEDMSAVGMLVWGCEDPGRTGNVSVCARRGVEMGEEGQVQLEGSGHKEKKGGEAEDETATRCEVPAPPPVDLGAPAAATTATEDAEEDFPCPPPGPGRTAEAPPRGSDMASHS